MKAIGRLKSPILLYLHDFVEMATKDAGTIPYLYRYLTVQSSVVKKGERQRYGLWHCDNPNTTMPVYVCVEGQQTEFKRGKSRSRMVYRLTKDDLHRSPLIKRTHRRSFLRLAFSQKLYWYKSASKDLNFMVMP